MSKAAANYMNSQLIRMEASFDGYTEGIALDSSGHLSEGSGMNVFLVHEGVVYTPPLEGSILPGITRAAVMSLCEDINIPVKEQVIPREMLYIVDEVFFAGTAVEKDLVQDRKSTRLNSSHPSISYAVFCLKKKNKTT